ncbi:alpha beta-hydrolase [Fusarium subglutinans]|uniref:Alpha beta-hydrolase n=1 Tax=Gibberella subglutinans TaxID=42677 RepID=A0A8H5QD88_GIBSU|nr:alpha beta-hydrolase [Fusarium subglutinans]KAF5613119.1 alpha beta-hydrolase [Fusarium subglutinans]
MGSSSSKTAYSASNTGGASVAAYELSSALTDTLSEINLNGSLNEQLRQLLERLDQEAAKYTNSKVNDDESIEWNPSQSEVQLISAAWKCARGTYDLESTLADTSYCTFRRDQVVDSSFAGTVKLITSTVVEAKAGSPMTDSLPVLVLAIRGSASKMDHIVNANAQPRTTESFISKGCLDDLKAHSGFLNSARALESIVTNLVNKYLESFDETSGKRPHILFTGHSAGGAVSQLLYLRHISNQDLNQSARFSCVTFGAPPCLTRHVDLDIFQPSSGTTCVNVINEFDVVTRADKPYILSLVDVARAMLDLLPKAAISEHETSEGIVSAALGSTRDDKRRLSDDSVDFPVKESNFWRFPQPFYHHVGPRLILLTRYVDNQMSLKAVEISSSEFQKLLFCRVTVHGKRFYEERIGALEHGLFNNRSAWKPDGRLQGESS